MHAKLSENIEPVHGSLKTIVRRAWLPKRVNNTRIWLEQYETLYVYEVRDIMTVAEIEKGKFLKVTVGQWVKVSDKLIKWVIGTTGQ